MKNLGKTFVAFVAILLLTFSCGDSSLIDEIKEIKPSKLESCNGNEGCDDDGDTPPPPGS